MIAGFETNRKLKLL